MYGYYDRHERRTRWAKTAALGVGAAALGVALANKERVESWANRTLDAAVDNATVQRYAKAATEFAFDRADNFQNLLQEKLGNTQYFRQHFVPNTELVDRADHTTLVQARHDLPRAEHEYKVARLFSETLSRVDSSTGQPTWSPEKIDSFLEDTGLFRTFIHERGTSSSEIPNTILRSKGRFQAILRQEAETNGRTFQEEITQSLRDANAVRAQFPDPPKRNKGFSNVMPHLNSEFAERLRKEIADGPSRLERLTGVSRQRVSRNEAGRLQGYTGENVNTSLLAGAKENARYRIGEKKYNFSAFQNILLSTKDVLSDRFSIPLSLFQQGISLGQLAFFPRSGDQPLLGIYNEGFQRNDEFQVFLGKKIFSMNDAGDVSRSAREYQFPKANKSYIRRMADAQEIAATETADRSSPFSRINQLFRGGLGEVEPGTTPYWDKIRAFFRKFNAKDYEPNLLHRAAEGKLESEEDALHLSKILRASSLKITTDDLVSLIGEMSNQRLLFDEPYGHLTNGTPLVRTPNEEELAWSRRQKANGETTWPRSVDEFVKTWAKQIQEGDGSEYAKYARSYDTLHELLARTHLSSPKLSSINTEMFGKTPGARERFLAQTASYADSRRAETLLGLDLTTGATRITNLDILRGEMMAGLQQISEDRVNTYDAISRRALVRGQTHASFLAQSFQVDQMIVAGGDVTGEINSFLSDPNQLGLRSYLERESRSRFLFLHVHPKNPKEEAQFGKRHQVLAIRTNKEERDGFLGLKRTWRAYTSPTSIKDQDATNGSVLAYFLMDRLHTAFHEIGIGLPAAMKTSPGHLAVGLIALRYIPLVLGPPEVHKFVNRVTRDIPLLRFLNPDMHRANVLDSISRSTHRGSLRHKALALIPGLDFYTDDRSKSDEDRAQRGAAYTPVRKGRWWLFGSREAFFGEKISYYAPSAARIARSDWQAADNVNRNNWLYWRHFGGYFNPMNWGKGAYWQEDAQKKERPYLTSGAAFDPDHPWSAPLNAALGWFFKPKKIYHPEYLPTHLGGTLNRQPTAARPTSPFYGRLSYDSHSVAQQGGGQSKGKQKPLPPGYSLSIPRPHRVRDAQYDPLIERINLARDLQGKDRLTRANEAGMAPEEAAYIRSIGLSGGWDKSLYHLQEIAGLYGWFGSLARPQIGHPVGKVEVADASRGYGRERRFYDQEIGGLGGNITDILRRFLPHRRRAVNQYDPVPNRMPTWVPGTDNLVDFKHGDPYTKVPLGEMRLPGSAYERLHPGTAARMFRLRASSIGKSQEEMEAFLVKKEGDGRAGAAAEMGTKMHRVLQDRWRRLGIMEADEVEVFDPKLNVTGHIDAILRLPDRQGRQQRVIADIKTKTAEKYAAVVRSGKPEAENLDQILFYMQATGIKRGLLTYVNREDIRQVHQIEVKFDRHKFGAAVRRMEAARTAVKERIRSGAVSAGELYDPLTKYEILADVAPYSTQFAELQKWAQHSKEAMSQEDQKRLEDAQERLKRQRDGFEIHAYRFRPQRVQSARVQIDRFIDRQTFLATSGQTYKIAGINAERANRLDTLSNEDWWHKNAGLKEGSHVTVSTETSSAPPKRVIAAALYAHGRNIGQNMLRKGIVRENKDDYSEPAKRIRFSPGELLFGRTAEWLLHQNNPIATKFFPVRSGLEQYERTDVYGKKSASWESSVSSYIWPTLASFTNKNPIAAAGMGALLGGTFFYFKEQKEKGLIYGAAVGVALSVFGLAMRAANKPFIPWAVTRRRKMDTYYDNLTYVKYRRLAAQEENLAKHIEGQDVNSLEEDNLKNVAKENKEYVRGLMATNRILTDRKEKMQTRLKRVRSPERSRKLRHQIQGIQEVLDTNRRKTSEETKSGRYAVGPHALQALLYRQRYRATMRGALEGGSWEAALSALPKSTRMALVDVINKGSTRDKTRLFQILPEDQKAVLGYALGVDERKIPKMQSLAKYFKAQPLPTDEWAGWRSDTSLDLIKARDIVTGHKHLDPMDFGIFPSTVEAATSGSPEADIPLPTRAPRYRGTAGLQQSLHDLLVGHGLSGVRVEVTETDAGGESHEADIDMQVSQRREHAFFNGFKNNAQKGAYMPN